MKKNKSDQLINKIQQIRSKNNNNWMDILRLGFKHDPKKASLMKNIYEDDKKISALVKNFTIITNSSMKNKDAQLIAEISANHCGSINLAKKLIYCAKINNADSENYKLILLTQ